MGDFVIQDGSLVTYLGNAADIVIPEGVRKIGQGAFIKNKNIKNVILPKSLTWIGDCAFSGCENLKSITIPAGVTLVGRLAFSNSGLENVVIEGKTKIELWAFDKTPWKENQLQSKGGFIRDGVLLRADPQLTRYTIPPEVKVIGRDAFKNSRIKELDIPQGVTKIDLCAFAYSALERISLPNNLRVIEAYAFSNCDKLTELTIPKSVTDIGCRAFEELPNCVLTILNECDNEGRFRIAKDAFGWHTPHIKEVRAPLGSMAMSYAKKTGLNVTVLPRTQ